MQYGQAEIVAFAQGMAQHTGVDIRVHNGQPRTDGKTVWLDCSPCQSQAEYEIRTGDADHEIAHVWFDTVAACKGAAATIAKNYGKPELEWAAHEILNVVVDIHDETRMEKLLPNVANALRQGNLKAGHAMIGARYTSKSPEWRNGLLAVILAARLGRKRSDGVWFYDQSKVKTTKYGNRSYKWQDAFNYTHVNWLLKHWHVPKEIVRIGMACREKAKPANVRRTGREWQKIIERARKIFEILHPQIQPQDQMPTATDGQGNPAGNGSGGPATPQQANDSGKRLRGAALANETGKANPGNDPMMDPGQRQGAPPPTKPANVQPAQPSKPGAGVGRGGGQSTESLKASKPFFNECMMTIGQAMDVMMETQDSMRLNHYRETGDRMGRKWPNLFTTGNVFVTKDRGDGRELNLAMVLDRSGSMQRILADCAAACAAIGMTAEDYGARVKAWAFASSGDSREYGLREMANGMYCGGSTMGAQALKEANQFLLDAQTGRRLCIVITDGEWGDTPEATALLSQGSRLGIEYVYIGLGMTREKLLEKWPVGLRGFGCPMDARALANQLLMVAGPCSV